MVTYALASITVPILFARNFLVLSENVSLVDIFDWRVYWSWVFCVFSILSGIVLVNRFSIIIIWRYPESLRAINSFRGEERKRGRSRGFTGEITLYFL